MGRRRWMGARAFAAPWAVVAAGLLLAVAAPARAAGLAGGVETVVIKVADLETATAFYTEVLDFEPVSEPVEVWGEDYERFEGVFGLRMRAARLRLGEETIELVEFLAPRGRPVPPDSRGNDRWFQHIAIIVSDMDEAYSRLRAHKVEHASSGPQRLPDWNPNAGGIEAFYFRDPDGHTLEVLAFPPGKGDPKWHRKSRRLFLGIDHTAIVVADTESSLRFYHDLLGLDEVGGSENYGVEQEHLNLVFGARLRITTLAAPSGPKIEFLEYLTPTDGRPYPGDARSNDLFQWSTRIAVGEAEAAWRAAAGARARLVSPGAVALPGAELGFGAGVLVRDPDGHALELVEPISATAGGGR